MSLHAENLTVSARYHHLADDSASRRVPEFLRPSIWAGDIVGGLKATSPRSGLNPGIYSINRLEDAGEPTTMRSNGSDRLYDAVMYYKSCIRISVHVTDATDTRLTPGGGRPRALGRTRSNDKQTQGSD